MPPTVLPLDWSRYRLASETVTRAIETLRPYPFRSLALPALSDEDYARLLDSIRAQGVTESLIVTPAGEVVDGQARLRAARQAGRPTVPTRVLEAPSEADYALWAANANLARRHLTSAQRFALVQAALTILEAQARERVKQTQFQPRGGSHVSARNTEGATAVANLPPTLAAPPHDTHEQAVPQTPVQSPNAPGGHTREQAARLVGVSPRQAAKMMSIAKRGSPELQEAVASGRLSIHRAYETLQGREHRQNGSGGRRGPHPAPRPHGLDDCLATALQFPRKTLRRLAAALIEWAEQPQEDAFYRDVQNLLDSCELVLRRRAAAEAEP